jgi:hypothetical protein
LKLSPAPRSQNQVGSALFADENKDAGGEGHDVEKENGWPEIQAEPQKAVDDQVNRKQKHADVFGDFHDVDLSNRLLDWQFKSAKPISQHAAERSPARLAQRFHRAPLVPSS